MNFNKVDKLTTNSNNSSQIQNENENYKTLNINNEHLNDKNLDKDDERLLNELDDEEEDDDEGDDENEDDEEEEDESDSDEEDEGDRLNDEDLDLDQDVNEFNRDLHNKNENLSVYSGNDSEMSETDENQENKLKLENSETNKVANQDTIMEIRRYLDNKKLTKINIVDDDDDDEDDDESQLKYAQQATEALELRERMYEKMTQKGLASITDLAKARQEKHLVFFVSCVG